jgi:transposase-like protein
VYTRRSWFFFPFSFSIVSHSYLSVRQKGYGPAKALVERTMEAELTGHLGYQKHDQGAKPNTNRRNGKTAKELRTNDEPMTIKVSRDREGSFEPRIVCKHQREFRGFDEKILSMYALGLTTRQIQDHLREENLQMDRAFAGAAFFARLKR